MAEAVRAVVEIKFGQSGLFRSAGHGSAGHGRASHGDPAPSHHGPAHAPAPRDAHAPERSAGDDAPRRRRRRRSSSNR